MRVLVTGSLSYDYIMNFPGRFADRIMPDKLHVISLSFLVDKLEKQFGGCATNLAYTLNLLGVEPYIVTAAGNDWKPYRDFLEKQNIDISGIQVFSDEPCSSYFVVTDRDDNQIGSFYVGASRYNDKLSIQTERKVDFVTIGPTDPKAMILYVRDCQRLRLPYMYDPAFQIGNFTREQLTSAIKHAAILIGNDYEIALIENKLGISHVELSAMVPILTTTLGAKGSIIETGNETVHIKPAKPRSVSDPTGAGDAYRAGFLAGYVRYVDRARGRRNRGLASDELLVCGQMGSVGAVYTVEKYGTVTHHYTKKEFIRRYQENYSSNLIL